MFNYKYFFSLLEPNTIMLDYGCGKIPLWNRFIHKKIKKIYLYDKVKIFIKTNKKKKLKIISDVGVSGQKIGKSYRNDINVVLLNSVIQYFDNKEFKVLSKFFKNNNIKLIILADIPLYNRYFEFLILFFFEPKRLLYALKYLLQFNYFSYKFHLRTEKKILNLIKCDYNVEKYFIIKKLKKNLNNSNFTRYDLYFKRK